MDITDRFLIASLLLLLFGFLLQIIDPFPILARTSLGPEHSGAKFLLYCQLNLIKSSYSVVVMYLLHSDMAFLLRAVFFFFVTV